MIFTNVLAEHRTAALFKHFQAPKEHRPAVREAYRIFSEAAKVAHEVRMSSTEAERFANEWAINEASRVFTINTEKAEEEYKAALAVLPETAEISRRAIETAFHAALRSANDVYDRAVGPSTLVFYAVDKLAVAIYETALNTAFDVFDRKVQAIIKGE